MKIKLIFFSQMRSLQLDYTAPIPIFQWFIYLQLHGLIFGWRKSHFLSSTTLCNTLFASVESGSMNCRLLENMYKKPDDVDVTTCLPYCCASCSNGLPGDISSKGGFIDQFTVPTAGNWQGAHNQIINNHSIDYLLIWKKIPHMQDLHGSI